MSSLIFTGPCVCHSPASPVLSQGKEFPPGPGTSEMLTLCWSPMSAEPVDLFLHFSVVISMTCTGFSHIFVPIIYTYCFYCWGVFLFGDTEHQFWAVLMPKSFLLFPHSWGCLSKLSLSFTNRTISVFNPKPKKTSHFVSATLSLSQGMEASALN